MIDATGKPKDGYRAFVRVGSVLLFMNGAGEWVVCGVHNRREWLYGWPSGDGSIGTPGHRCRHEGLVRDSDPLATASAGTRSANKGKRRE